MVPARQEVLTSDGSVLVLRKCAVARMFWCFIVVCQGVSTLTAWTAQSLHLHPVYPIVAVLCASGRPTLVSFSFSRLLVLRLSAEACLAVFSRSRLFVCALV